MSKSFRRVVLAAAFFSLSPFARAQSEESWRTFNFGATYTTERAKIAATDCGCFWLRGGSADASIKLFHSLGIAAELTGLHKSGIGSGVDLNQISFMAGPRYTYRTHRWSDRFLSETRPSSIFGEALFGVAHGFNGVFPTSSGLVTSANSSSVQIGGGLNIALAHGFGVRAFELDYVRTSLPNDATGTQNDLRLAFGVTYGLHER
jgi:hypothetical protein